jgi:hypothetical protein
LSFILIKTTNYVFFEKKLQMWWEKVIFLKKKIIIKIQTKKNLKGAKNHEKSSIESQA